MAGFGDIEIPRDLLFKAILKLEFQSGIKLQFESKMEKASPQRKGWAASGWATRTDVAANQSHAQTHADIPCPSACW